jgi:hypothetical protein
MNPEKYENLVDFREALQKANREALRRLNAEEAAARPVPTLVFDGDESLRCPEWLAYALVPVEGAGMLFGETNTGKTFTALDLAVRVAAGKPWLGRAVKQGSVVFVEAEGGHAFAVRKHAAKGHAGLGDALGLEFTALPFLTILEPLGFGPDTDPEFVATRAAAIKAEVVRRGMPPVRLVVVDTLAQNMDGDVDNNRDMVAFLRTFRAFLKALSDEPVFGLLIHHPGHSNKDRGRGAYALPADLDLIMHLEGTQDALTLSCRRMRDAEEFQPIALKLEQRTLTVGGEPVRDSTGRQQTSLVLLPRTEPTAPATTSASLARRIIDHLSKHPGQTTQQIRSDLGVAKSKVVFEVDRLVDAGSLSMTPVKTGKTARQTYDVVEVAEGNGDDL